MGKSSGILSIEVMGKLVLAILALALLLVMSGVAKEQIEGADQTTGIDFSFGCKNINDAGADDTDKETVSFWEFMAAMKEVYERCRDKNECRYDACKRMNIKLEEGKACYKIGTAAITEYVGEMFNAPITGYTRIYCEKRNSRDDELLILNKHGNTAPVCNKEGLGASYFSIAKNSKVEIRALKTPMFLGEDSVDVEIKISEGEKSDYDNCEDAPTTANCATDDVCKTNNDETENDHTYCNTNINRCVYLGYCKHMCDVVGGGACPADSGCNKMTLTCTETSCIPKSNTPPPAITSPTMGCESSAISATFKKRIDTDEGLLVKWALYFETDPPRGVMTDTYLTEGNSRYYKKSGTFLRSADIQSSSMQMSLMLEKLDSDTGETIVYIGCNPP